MNCWEFNRCGREHGGCKVEELGLCKAAADERTHGVNNGTNAGRICWLLAGTFNPVEKTKTCIRDIDNCLMCDFYYLVEKEEAKNFVFLKDLGGR